MDALTLLPDQVRAEEQLRGAEPRRSDLCGENINIHSVLVMCVYIHNFIYLVRATGLFNNLT